MTILHSHTEVDETAQLFYKEGGHCAVLSDTDPLADGRWSGKSWNGVLLMLSGLATGVPVSFDITSPQATAGLKEELAARQLKVEQLTVTHDAAKAAVAAAKQSVDDRTEKLRVEVHTLILFIVCLFSQPHHLQTLK